VNADIAERVAQGRLSAAPQYAQAYGADRGRMLEALGGMGSLQEGAQGRELGALEGMRGLYGMDIDKLMQSLHGARSLYGTTPGLSETFGRQALSGQQLGLERDRLKQQGDIGMSQIAANIYGGGRR